MLNHNLLTSNFFGCPQINFQLVVHQDPSAANKSADTGNYGGSLLESEIFKMLQQTFEKSTVQDTVVISGWNDSTPSAKKEFDFLIVSLPLKAIIHIEVKRTLNKTSKEKAIKQLNDGLSIIISKVPFQKESKWTYIQYICFSQLNDSDEEITQFLESHLLTLNIMLGKWWTDLLNQILEDYQHNVSEGCEEDTETYLNILKYLLHQMFIQEDVLTQGKLL